MTHEQLATHLANLVTLLRYHEELGSPKNKWVAAEFDKHNEEFIKGLKEKHDETRKSEPKRPSLSEGRTEGDGNKPGGGGTDRGEDRPKPSL